MQVEIGGVSGFAVDPKRDCPHVLRHLKWPRDRPSDEVFSVETPCKKCGHVGENWMSLDDHSVYCSRYVEGHMLEYFCEQNHLPKDWHDNGTRPSSSNGGVGCIVCSFADLSVFCYECDSYITHPRLSPYLAALSKSKFADSDSADDLDELAESLSRARISLPGPPIEDVATGIRDAKYKKILVLTGAGISTSAGIPDFRSPGSGLYDNLQKYNLPYPTAVFDIEYFRNNPNPFYLLAKELFPGQYKPTLAHFFVKVLSDKGILLRNYTQNIDTLEREAGMSGDAVIECHGSFAGARCIECRASYPIESVKESIMSGQIFRCSIPSCDGLVKPNIVFFGESLPKIFGDSVSVDTENADLLIVMGTSLRVAPVSGIPSMVDKTIPRIFINRESLSDIVYRPFAEVGTDVEMLGDLQLQVWRLAKLCGFDDELWSLYSAIHKDASREKLDSDLSAMLSDLDARSESAPSSSHSS